MTSTQRCRTLRAKIAQLKGKGEIAPSFTWISSYSVPKKNGKRYIYYRLMKAHPDRSGGKMVRYLGSSESEAYQEMKKAIARRNQIQALERELERLEKSLSGEEKQPPLTTTEKTVVAQLKKQVGELVEQVEMLKRQLGELLRDRNARIESL